MSEEPEVAEIKIYLYVERKTNYLYDTQFFDKFVIVRPATPGFEQVLRKLSFPVFHKEFEEYGGDIEEVRRALRGEAIEEPIIATRK